MVVEYRRHSDPTHSAQASHRNTKGSAARHCKQTQPDNCHHSEQCLPKAGLQFSAQCHCPSWFSEIAKHRAPIKRQARPATLPIPNCVDTTQGRTISDGGIRRETSPRKLSSLLKKWTVVAIQMTPLASYPMAEKPCPMNLKRPFMSMNASAAPYGNGSPTMSLQLSNFAFSYYETYGPVVTHHLGLNHPLRDCI